MKWTSVSSLVVYRSFNLHDINLCPPQYKGSESPVRRVRSLTSRPLCRFLDCHRARAANTLDDLSARASRVPQPRASKRTCSRRLVVSDLHFSSR
ncbi:hypothetical protein C0Q70_02945 [Pomacea canaliculata]|uniref:Uncharacterized protein n=1 Tax=Pomacea canaliculata TaxID=400727 RepID=A0A2T7PRC1_POMCA|nr:hypothetical protein C0Q70_02945 [Pomacea canaliculata]